jgi:hypothetical protein
VISSEIRRFKKNPIPEKPYLDELNSLTPSPGKWGHNCTRVPRDCYVRWYLHHLGCHTVINLFLQPAVRSQIFQKVYLAMQLKTIYFKLLKLFSVLPSCHQCTVNLSLLRGIPGSHVSVQPVHMYGILYTASYLPIDKLYI